MKHTVENMRLWLALDEIPSFGSATAIKLFEHLTITELFASDVSALRHLGFNDKQVNAIQHPNWAHIDKNLGWLDSSEKQILCYVDDDYPLLLKEIASCPLVLYIQGNKKQLDHDQIAIVGTRNPSMSGKETAHHFSKAFSEAGLTVTSGLAIGIDGIAHQAAIDCNKPTVAVLGTGVDVIYPRRHKQLAEQILQHDGVLVSEFAPGTQPLAHHFPRRNRVISGLSLGTLVAEAALKSGSLITAKYALEQNREVFAVPGSINNPQAKGCHFLIRQGAKLVECPEHVYEELPNLNIKPINNLYRSAKKIESKDLAADRLLVSVDYEPTPVDSIVSSTGLPVSEVLQKLLQLELEGLVATAPGGYIRLRGS